MSHILRALIPVLCLFLLSAPALASEKLQFQGFHGEEWQNFP